MDMVCAVLCLDMLYCGGAFTGPLDHRDGLRRPSRHGTVKHMQCAHGCPSPHVHQAPHPVLRRLGLCHAALGCPALCHAVLWQVTVVNYPGLESHPQHALCAKLFDGGRCGGVFSFECRGGVEPAEAFLKARAALHCVLLLRSQFVLCHGPWLAGVGALAWSPAAASTHVQHPRTCTTARELVLPHHHPCSNKRATSPRVSPSCSARLAHGSQALRLALVAPSLGGVETLVTRPATTTHIGMAPEQRAAVGISDGLVRVAVGIEDTDDLLRDFMGGVAAARAVLGATA